MKVINYYKNAMSRIKNRSLPKMEVNYKLIMKELEEKAAKRKVMFPPVEVEKARDSNKTYYDLVDKK